VTLQELLSLLSQLNHVLAQLDRPWRRAMLERTRLCEPVFLGDVLAVISMCSTGLRSGTPLPQITPSPLIARFVGDVPFWADRSVWASSRVSSYRMILLPMLARFRPS